MGSLQVKKPPLPLHRITPHVKRRSPRKQS